MEEIRKAGKEYNAEDIYNMDETGYYWKMKPDWSLSTLETSRKKIVSNVGTTGSQTADALNVLEIP